MCPCMYDFYSSKQGTSSPQRWRVNRHCEKAIKARVVTAEVAKKAQKNLVCKNSTRVTCLWLTRSLEDAWKVFFFFFCVQSMSAPSDVSILSLFFLPCKKDVTKTVRNKNNKTKSGGDYFFYFFFRYKWFIASNDLKTSRGQSERKPGTEKIQMLRESFTTGACRIPADSRRCTLNVECCVSSLCKDDSTIRV